MPSELLTQGVSRHQMCLYRRLVKHHHLGAGLVMMLDTRPNNSKKIRNCLPSVM